MNRVLRSIISVACVVCLIGLWGQLNVYAFYNSTFPLANSTLYGGLNTNLGFMGGMINPCDFNGLSTGFLGTSILNLIPNSLSFGTYFPKDTSFSPIFDRTYQAYASDEVIRSSNPVSDFQNPTWMFPRFSINEYGLGNAFFDPVNFLTTPVMEYPYSIPWVNPIGLGYPLCPVPSACLNPFGSGFGMGFPMHAVSPYNGSVFPSPVVLPPVPLPDHNSKYYVEVTYEEAGQTIYVLLLDDGEDSQMELQDILEVGIHCVKVKNPGIQTSYSIHFGESNSSLSLYQDTYSKSYIWAWE